MKENSDEAFYFFSKIQFRDLSYFQIIDKILPNIKGKKKSFI